MTAQSPTRERRSIQLHVEVPGTPEQVWQAIATGPGIGAWITAAEVVGREGGTISLDLGSGMEECAVVTTWEPPRRLVAQEEWPGSDGAPARLVSEWLVEPNSRSTCLVRLRTIVDSAAESRADWDRELASMREGWTMFLRNLWLYRAYFADQPCSRIVARTPTTGPLARAWRELAERLGIAHAVEGERVHVDAPPLVGLVVREIRGDYHAGLTLRLDEPAPGFALLFVNSYRDAVYANLRAYLFGPGAAAAARRMGSPPDGGLPELSLR